MISDAARHGLNQRLKKLLEDCEVIAAGVVATIDGHMVATQYRETFPMERLAAMGSSLMALGDTITAELSMGTCDKIISENQDGIVAFMHIDNALVLITLTKQKHGLGLLLSYSRRCAQDMAKAV